jgi:hypothetical protein
MPQQHLVRGYHGTTLPRAQQIVATGQIRISRNDYDWLGQGAYFFQDAPLRAWKWATEWVAPRANEPAAVISADISLKHCFDLVDLANWRYLLLAHGRMAATSSLPAQRPPVVRSPTGRRVHILSPAPVTGRSGHNALDCAVAKLAIAVYRKIRPVQSVRGAFVEGQQLYDNSYFFDHSHVQIAVLDHAAIVKDSLALEDSQALSQAYQSAGMTRWPV